MVRFSLSTLTLVLSLSSAEAQSLPAAIDVLDALPPSISLADAHGVVIVPGANRMYNATGWTGRAVLVRNTDGWSTPAFVTLNSGARTGGGELVDLVLVFRTRRGLERVVNGGGRIDSDVTAYVRNSVTFTETSLAGATLSRGSIFSFGPDRDQAAALKAKLTDLTAHHAAPGTKPTAQIDWALVLENREVVLSALAVAGTWLARRRTRGR
ncbi:hypothetical protein J8F10_02020 [Gemmata sp. G18]|uniref:Uncharacterized protein n=1 Tax=Gemmata palustris TaxID=2822762 RepID=A0ABS5BKR4_9BACT|nr:hypothetical protein [Gemmata palustris]MBP3954072.1 hypothetical protein [Gemmata palustris]